jgi:cysteine synthase
VSPFGPPQVVHVTEADTIRTCHWMSRHGFLFGGPTGAVVSAATRWLAANHQHGNLTAVAISPDLGERYVDTIYQTTWLRTVYSDDLLSEDT